MKNEHPQKKKEAISITTYLKACQVNICWYVSISGGINPIYKFYPKFNSTRFYIFDFKLLIEKKRGNKSITFRYKRVCLVCRDRGTRATYTSLFNLRNKN
jgi:hypothetical protein